MSRARKQAVALVLVALFCAHCASSTVIRTSPAGARVYVNGVPVGTTPYTMTDRKTAGSSTTVRLEHPGHDPVQVVITRNERLDVLALVGGLFLLVPLLWIMEYDPDRYYELRPAGAAGPGPGAPRGHGDAHERARRANELNAEGRKLVAAGDYEAAAARFEQAIALFPDPRFFFNLCLALEAAGRIAQAIGACEQVYAHEPSDRLRDKTDERLRIMRGRGGGR